MPFQIYQIIHIAGIIVLFYGFGSILASNDIKKGLAVKRGWSRWLFLRND